MCQLSEWKSQCKKKLMSKVKENMAREKTFKTAKKKKNNNNNNNKRLNTSKITVTLTYKRICSFSTLGSYTVILAPSSIRYLQI